MKEVIRKKRIVESEHIHVDNGGYSFSLVQYDYDSQFEEWVTSLEISEGFHGYSEGKISFFEKITPDTLEKIGLFFLRSADKLREVGICRKGE